MCTVLFIPNKISNYFVSLRDESPMRTKALLPLIVTKNKINFLSPIDPVAGGTWIGTNEFGNTIVLLNGGFKSHQKKNNYRKSRGLIVAELLANEKRNEST